MNFNSFSDEFLKLSAVTREEAEASLKRLKTLEETKPTAGQIARGALAGGVAGTASQLAKGLVTGDLKRGIATAMEQPTARGKMNALAVSALKNVGGTLAGSAALGSTLPTLRGHLDREAEKEKLREFLGQKADSRAHRKVKKVLGL